MDIFRWYVHGVSYVDERLMMRSLYDPLLGGSGTEIGKTFYYAIDRMYNVRTLIDSAGAIVESYAYDPYGKPLIREAAGRGDMTGDAIVNLTVDEDQFDDACNCTTFDPRADLNDDGYIDSADESLFYAKAAIWDGTGPADVKLARSLVGNPYMFQGRPNFIFATDMTGEATDAELMLNDHRNRFADPMTGRWLTRAR